MNLSGRRSLDFLAAIIPASIMPWLKIGNSMENSMAKGK